MTGPFRLRQPVEVVRPIPPRSVTVVSVLLWLTAAVLLATAVQLWGQANENAAQLGLTDVDFPRVHRGLQTGAAIAVVLAGVDIAAGVFLRRASLLARGTATAVSALLTVVFIFAGVSGIRLGATLLAAAVNIAVVLVLGLRRDARLFFVAPR